MEWLAKLVLPIFVTAALLTSAPPNTVGQWKVGQPFLDMKHHPVGLNSKQEKMLIGQVLTIESTSITACGKRIPLESAKEENYSPEAFLQKYGILPNQIGLESIVTEVSFKFAPSAPVCGNSEGIVLLSDGHHFTLEDGNDYFVLSKIKTNVRRPTGSVALHSLSLPLLSCGISVPLLSFIRPLSA